jgi:hypothetical protein
VLNNSNLTNYEKIFFLDYLVVKSYLEKNIYTRMDSKLKDILKVCLKKRLYIEIWIKIDIYY